MVTSDQECEAIAAIFKKQEKAEKRFDSFMIARFRILSIAIQLN